jgi:hypothetical protein
MRELTKSFLSYSLACSLFGLKQMESLLTPRDRSVDRDPASHAFDAVTDAYTEQFGETLNSVFRTIDNTQRGMVSLVFSFFGEGTSPRRERDSREPRVVTEINWRSEPAHVTYEDLRTGAY